MGAQGPFLHERLFPFQGPWHLPWVIHRYFVSALPAFTPARLANAFLCLAEMKTGRAKVRSGPTVLRVEPTNHCNLRCPLCVCGLKRDPRPKGFMSTDDFTRVLDENRRTAMILRLDGMGEPTLHKGLFDMISMAKSRRLSVSLHSNFDTPACADPVPFLNSRLDRLVLSIDGATQTTYEKYRVGGNFTRVMENLSRLLEARKARRGRRPIVEVQFIHFDHNEHEIPAMRRLCAELGVDRFMLTEPQYSVLRERLDPQHPKRCFSLWTVLTVGWDLDYHSCTNAWSLPFPRLSMREVPSMEIWNHPTMQEARRFNVDKSSEMIAQDTGCKCMRCPEMMVAPLTGSYLCE